MAGGGNDQKLVGCSLNILEQLDCVERSVVMPGINEQCGYLRMIAATDEIDFLPSRICRRYLDKGIEVRPGRTDSAQHVLTGQLESGLRNRCFNLRHYLRRRPGRVTIREPLSLVLGDIGWELWSVVGPVEDIPTSPVKIGYSALVELSLGVYSRDISDTG